MLESISALFENVTGNLIAGFLSIPIVALSLKLWNKHKHKFAQERIKFTYYRILRLSVSERGDNYAYLHSHHSKALADHEGTTEVYDEVLCINSSYCRFPEIPLPISLKSLKGVVDAVQILPVVAGDQDNNPITRGNPKNFTAYHDEPSCHLMIAGSMINALQSKDSWFFATQAQHDNQTAVLVLDFSSLPFSDAIKNIHAIVERNHKTLSKSDLKSNFIEERVSNAIFVARFENAKKDDVLRINFEIDNDRVPVQRSPYLG